MKIQLPNSAGLVRRGLDPVEAEQDDADDQCSDRTGHRVKNERHDGRQQDQLTQGPAIEQAGFPHVGRACAGPMFAGLRLDRHATDKAGVVVVAHGHHGGDQ